MIPVRVELIPDGYYLITKEEDFKDATDRSAYAEAIKQPRLNNGTYCPVLFGKALYTRID